MKASAWRGRLTLLSVMVATAVLNMGGCTGLSDQQLASVWQSVLTAAFTTVVQGLLAGTGGA